MKLALAFLFLICCSGLLLVATKAYLDEDTTSRIDAVSYDYETPEAQMMEAMRAARRTDGDVCFVVRGHAELTGKYCVEFSPK